MENFDSTSKNTSRLILSNLHFSEICQKFGQNKYFVLVSCTTEVQSSKFVTTNHNFITFDDVFIFDNCPLEFCIKIQLYVLKLGTKLRIALNRVSLTVIIYLYINILYI